VTSGSVTAVAEAIRSRESFVITSHARPDGDAIGSSLALALGLEQLGKRVTVVLRDPAPRTYQSFPAIDRLTIAERVDTPADAAIVLECSDITRPGVAGLDRYTVINIDHHLGNTMYGAVNWFDEGAAACAELVAGLLDVLGVTWTPAIATHLYLGISTDTGGLRYGPISERTYETCRRIVATGVDTPLLSRQIFESYSIGRVRLTGALLNAMTLHHDNQIAVLAFDDGLLARCGATTDDTEGLVNLPLGASEVVAVAMLKQQADGSWRISLRSKGPVDVRSVAMQWQGGGHRNASGCTLTGDRDTVASTLVAAMTVAVDVARQTPAVATH
jgi:phosphoesterase RecJ-like protein